MVVLFHVKTFVQCSLFHFLQRCGVNSLHFSLRQHFTPCFVRELDHQHASFPFLPLLPLMSTLCLFPFCFFLLVCLVRSWWIIFLFSFTCSTSTLEPSTYSFQVIAGVIEALRTDLTGRSHCYTPVHVFPLSQSCCVHLTTLPTHPRWLKVATK